MNWRAVHVKTGTGLQITPNSVLAGESFANLSRPPGQHTVTLSSVFAVEDRPDMVCAMLIRVASRLPECNPDAVPTAVPAGAMTYKTEIPLRSPGLDGDAKATFLRWIWYAARRDGLHLDEAEDTFTEPHLVTEAIRTVVAPVLRLSPEQQQAMAANVDIERYGAGELVLENGVVPTAVYFILAGRIVFTAEAEDGTRTEVDIIERGSYLGHSTLVRHPVTGSYFAIDEVTVVRVYREAIEDVVQGNPVLLQEFGRAIDERRSTVLRALAESSANQGETSK